MPGTGQTTIDFGAFPGTLDASVTITGQGAIVSGSLVEAWVYPIATADHSVAEHYTDPPRIMAGEITAAAGFVIRGFSLDQRPRYGLYTINWAWT